VGTRIHEHHTVTTVNPTPCPDSRVPGQSPAVAAGEHVAVAGEVDRDTVAALADTLIIELG
jgi:hypothetical protein